MVEVPFPPPPAPKDEDNIMAALKHHDTDRVCSLRFTVSGSPLKFFSTTSEPFSELEDLVLMS